MAAAEEATKQARLERQEFDKRWTSMTTRAYREKYDAAEAKVRENERKASRLSAESNVSCP